MQSTTFKCPVHLWRRIFLIEEQNTTKRGFFVSTNREAVLAMIAVEKRGMRERLIRRLQRCTIAYFQSGVIKQVKWALG